jgi:hypothetical protein
MEALDTLKSLSSPVHTNRRWKQSCYDAMNDDFNSQF